MTVFSLDNLTQPQTAAQVRESIYATLAALGVTTTNWRPGAVVRTLITAFSILIAALTVVAAQVTRSGFLPTAEGDWLKWLAKYQYGVDAQEATFATTTVILTNTGGGSYSFDPDDLTFRNTSTNALYRNTEAVVIAPLATNVSCPVRAVEAGSASSALPGEIAELVTVVLGVNCTNPTAAIGLDAESDESLRVRAQESLGALSPNGPSDAYAYVARSAKRVDGTPIGVTRIAVIPTEDFELDVYVADADGPVASLDVARIDDLLQEQCVPIPVTARTHSAAAVTIPITYQAWMPQSTGFSVTEVRAAIAAELAAMFAAEPIGGHAIGSDRGIWKDNIAATIGRAKTAQGVPLQIFRVNVTLPATAYAELTPTQVAVLGTVTGTISQV